MKLLLTEVKIDIGNFILFNYIYIYTYIYTHTHIYIYSKNYYSMCWQWFWGQLIMFLSPHNWGPDFGNHCSKDTDRWKILTFINLFAFPSVFIGYLSDMSMRRKRICFVVNVPTVFIFSQLSRRVKNSQKRKGRKGGGGREEAMKERKKRRGRKDG